MAARRRPRFRPPCARHRARRLETAKAIWQLDQAALEYVASDSTTCGTPSERGWRLPELRFGRSWNGWVTATSRPRSFMPTTRPIRASRRALRRSRFRAVYQFVYQSEPNWGQVGPPKTALDREIHPGANPLVRSHNPEVAGSNPAPAIREGPANPGPSRCLVRHPMIRAGTNQVPILRRLRDFQSCNGCETRRRAGTRGERPACKTGGSEKSPDFQCFLQWRDPDSNRGHHDFQSCGGSLSKPHCRGYSSISRWLVRVFPDFAVLCRLIRPTEGSVGLFLALHIEVAHQVLADLLVGGHVRRPGLGTSRRNALSRLVVRKSASSSSMRGSRPLDSNVGRRNCASQVG